MKLTLRDIISAYSGTGKAIGHFNVSDITGLRAVADAAKSLGLPVIIGVSEGERSAIGVRQIALLVKSIREDYQMPIFLNADHTHSLESAQAAVAAGFDAVLFDGGKLPFNENIEKTRQAVIVLKSMNPALIVEGELGYIGSSSQIFDSLPEGAAIRSEDLTSPEDAKKFVEETEVDMLAPAVGNIHGMFANAPNPKLDIERIRDIKKAVGVPMVLHGGSGVADDDFRQAINSGISIVHINTEIRKAWRDGIEGALLGYPNEVVPYKLLDAAYRAVRSQVISRMKLFSGN